MQKNLSEILIIIIQRHFIPISVSLFIHLIIISLLILIDIKQSQSKKLQEIIIEIQNIKDDYEETIKKINEAQSFYSGEEENLKNIPKNLADPNKSFNDYYKEAKDLLENFKTEDKFKSEDYSDKKILIKDYSMEVPDIKNWDKPIDSILNKNESEKTYAGNTIISYDLGGRKAKKLSIPAYKCLGSGSIAVEITVNRKGEVKSAKIVKMSSSLNETCIPESALQAALNSLFFADYNAPEVQKGFIYYQFIKQ